MKDAATGERIRDKIAASKRKGMWMGGVPTLGYAFEGKTRELPLSDEEQLLDVCLGVISALADALWAIEET